MGRPKLNIDVNIVFKLAKIHCTRKEIANFFGCNIDTITDRFSEIIERGNAAGKEELRAVQWKIAMKGNSDMAKWLGREILGQGRPIAPEMDTTAIDELNAAITKTREEQNP